MKRGPLREKSFAFAVRIVKLSAFLVREKREFVLSRQLLRSGTAIGALVREAEQAESKRDFVHKLALSLKESNETEYWVALLRECGHLTDVQANSIERDNAELLRLLTSIIKTTKRRSPR